MSAIEALIKISQQQLINVLDITSIRPEDGSGKRWLYRLNYAPRDYYIEFKD